MIMCYNIYTWEVKRMGKTSSAVKDRYNKKAYDSVLLRMPKGEKERVQAAADAAGKSLNAFIMDAVAAQMPAGVTPDEGT